MHYIFLNRFINQFKYIAFVCVCKNVFIICFALHCEYFGQPRFHKFCKMHCFPPWMRYHLIFHACLVNICVSDTVPHLKSCHRRRSLFLITGGHHILHELRDHYSMFHQPPIEIYVVQYAAGRWNIE